MNRAHRKQLLGAAGLLVAAGLGWTWWERHGLEISASPTVNPWLGATALICLSAAIALQIVRTSWLMGCRPKGLTRPLLMAHGMNVWLPSMMGDLFEVWAVAKVAKKTKRSTLILLGHRFCGTVAALMVLAAIAIGPLAPSISAALIAAAVGGYLLIDRTLEYWVRWLRVESEDDDARPRPLGARATLAHLGLAVTQHGIEAAGVFFIGIAVGTAVAPGAAAGMVSIIEMITYLPIPMGGAGANHWGATTALQWLTPGRNTGLLVVTAHGLHVGLGAVTIGIASMLGRDDTPSHTA